MLNDLLNNLPMYLMRIPVILLALTVHEAAHGWMAYKMGDPTARNLGRLTLNPLRHLDPVGTLMMLVVGFGWAKPVPVNTRNFTNPRRGMALTALAGPLSNFLMSLGGMLLFRILFAVFMAFSLSGHLFAWVVLLFVQVFYTLNLYLAIFNMLPVPPMDGSRILFVFLPDKYYFGIMKYERYIMMAMMLLLITGTLSLPLGFVAGKIESGFMWLLGFIPFL